MGGRWKRIKVLAELNAGKTSHCADTAVAKSKNKLPPEAIEQPQSTETYAPAIVTPPPPLDAPEGKSNISTETEPAADKKVQPSIIAAPPVLSSPQEAQENTNKNDILIFGPNLIPWAIFFAYFSFLVVALFQYRFIADHAEQSLRRTMRNSPEWRLAGIFTATLAAMTVTQLGYAIYASFAYFRSLERLSALPWLFFALGFLPLPPLLVEALCAVRHPGIGATRHYHNNLRLSHWYMADWLNRLEGRRRALNQHSSWANAPERWVLGSTRLGLVYILSPLFLFQIRRNRIQKFWHHPFRVAGQFFVDLQIIYVLVLGILALGLAAAQIDPSAGLPLWGKIRIDARLLIRGYLFCLGYSAFLIVWLAKDSPDAEVAGQKQLSLRLLATIAILLGLVGADIWVATLPLREGMPSLADATNAEFLEFLYIYVAWANYMARAYVGGWAPVGLVLAVLVLAIHYQLAVGRIWQSLGVSLGQRVPFASMMKTRHRGLNLLSPMQLALSEAILLIETPERTNPEAVRRMLDRALSSSAQMEAWFEDIRRGGAALDWSASEVDSTTRVKVAEILGDVASATEAFVKRSQATEEMPAINIEISIQPEAKDLYLDINKAALHDCLCNIAHNACEAMANHSANLPQHLVRIAAGGSDDPLYFLAVTVDDTGPGVPKELLGRIFDPLFTHGKKKGTGMGLYLAKSFMDHIGGTIAVGRSPFGGARFVLSFPIDIAASTATGNSNREART